MENTKKTSFWRKYLPDEKLIAVIVVAVFLLAVGLVWLSYQPKTTGPKRSVQVAGVKIVNKDKTSAFKQLNQAAATQKIAIKIKDQTYTYSAKDLGVKRDFSSLLDTAYAPPDSLINKRLIINPDSTLKTYILKKQLIGAIDNKLGDNKTTVNASVGIDGGNLVVNPGRAGISIDYDQLITQIEKTNLNGSVNIAASFTQQQPAIPTDAAAAAKTQAETLIQPDYGVSAESKSTRYASRAQKTGWLVFTPDQATHKITAAINIVAARNTMNKIAQGFAQSVKDRVTLTGTDGYTTVLDEGQSGLSVDQASINTGLDKLSTAITNRNSLTFPVAVATKPQGERNLGTSTGGKFVLVDIAAFKTYAINNTTVERTMLVSTGQPGMPTHKGHFTIRSKAKLITMKGCNAKVGCWVVPNVPNAQFFTDDGEALHGTYWHNQFGIANLSHGCVNLTLADAAWLFDWTAVGTDVVVV